MVEIAYSAPGTFEAVQRMKPEVVFLDIGLPQMDGYEIARRLRTADPGAKRMLGRTDGLRSGARS